MSSAQNDNLRTLLCIVASMKEKKRKSRGFLKTQMEETTHTKLKERNLCKLPQSVRQINIEEADHMPQS